MSELQLNLGCGSKLYKGFINVDVRVLPGIDQVADIRNLPFPDGSAKMVFLEDVLEHFILSDAVKVLKECVRVLRPKGECNIKVPDILTLSDLVRDDKITPFDYQEYLYGGQDYPENFHKCGFTPQFLSGICYTVGFSRIDLVEKQYPNFRMLVIK